MRHGVTMALVWFFCLGALGVWFPFFALYLDENAGLSGAQVGAVMAMLPLVGMLAQPLWGQTADLTGSRARQLALLAFGAAAGYALLALPSSFGGLLAATAVLAFFSTAVIPSCIAVTLALARDAGPHAFGRTRVWGTVGFLLAVLAFPWLLDAWEAHTGAATRRGPALSEPALAIMFPVTAAIAACGAACALLLPRDGEVALRAARGDWRLLLRHGPYLRVLGFGLLAYLCVQGPQVFFPVFVRSLGGDIDTVSRMWIPMLALEIPLIALSGAALERIGARGLLAIGTLAGGLRWAVCGFAPDLAWVWPAQLLHGVVVAGLVIGGPLYVELVVPQRLRSTGQGLFVMLGFGIGGIASNLATGWLIERSGAGLPYAVGGIGALALGLLAAWILPAPRRAD
jgi:PPP family 3-phenylpropionic acid transporter